MTWSSSKNPRDSRELSSTRIRGSTCTLIECGFLLAGLWKSTISWILRKKRNDRRQVLLVNVYRYVTDTIEWEIPAGALENDESILEAARREVWEESGYETTHHKLIYTYYPMNGISNKVFHIVRCRVTKKTGDFDRNEVKEFKWVSRQEVQAMVQDKQMRDGFSLTALLLYLTQEE